MPKIEIRERDLTTASNANTTTNAVYIPGYANYGPVNTPTLCETVEEFYNTFGSTPYRFRQDYAWSNLSSFDNNARVDSMGDMYEAGDYEKSYLIAERLLSLGLPVWYERVFSDNVNAWTAASHNLAYTVKAKYPGFAGSLIYYYLTKDTQSIDDAEYSYYTFHIGRGSSDEYGLKKIEEVTIQFTYSEVLHKNFSRIKLIAGPNFTLEDDSGLTIIEFNKDNATESNTSLISKDAPYKLIETVAGPAINSNTDEFAPLDIYTHLSNNITNLSDKGEYVLKFITTGAYPVFEYNNNSLAIDILEVAAGRGDCTFLLDHTPNNKRSLLRSDGNSVFAKVTEFARTPRSNDYVEDSNTFAAMFTPYGIYETSEGDQMLPASFGYLAAYAKQANLTNNWLATAGVDRGTVPYLKSLCQNVTNAIADSYTPRDSVSINPITNIKPYGLIIWGARTLKDNAKEGDLVATSFLNIRQITNDVKRQIWVAAKSLTFEQNSEILWIRFKSKITPLLDNMVNANGLSTYEIRRQKADKRATVKAVIRLYAIEPVEDWDITVELADSTTVVLG